MPTSGYEPEPVGAGASPLSTGALQLVDRVHALGSAHAQSLLGGVLQRSGAGEPDIAVQIGDAALELIDVGGLEEDLLRSRHSEVITDCSKQPWRE